MISEIELDTRDQSSGDNSVWIQQRMGRITGTSAHSVCNFRGDKPGKTVINKIMGREQVFSNNATVHGKRSEILAKEMYKNFRNKAHTNLKVSKAGLVISKKFPFLGASPDGRVTCKCCGSGIIEVKSSFKNKHLTPIEAAKLTCQHLDVKNDHVSVKKTSPWYSQIQHQLLVTGADWCDFVFYTEIDPCISTKRIYPDIKWQENSIPLMVNFWKRYIMQDILDQ